ncbi:MAG TPA: carboxypeptidase-like regulatory domain-containing protein [Acidobacteriaceae bacterium]
MNPSFPHTGGPRSIGQRLIAVAALSAGVMASGGCVATAQTPGMAARPAFDTPAALGGGLAKINRINRMNGMVQASLQPAVSGVVRDAAGSPQIGALVELLGPNLAVVARTFTDARGRYALPQVTPGVYGVKASGSFFLPTLRENLRMLANRQLVVNLTLNTLYQAFQWLPAQPRGNDEPRDDWNWTLRLSTNRPLLRVLEDDNAPGPMVLVNEGTDVPASTRRVTVRSGSNRFGEGGMHQDVEIERTDDDAHQLIFRTEVGQTDSATIQTTAAYLRQAAPGTALLSVASFSERPDVISGSDRGLEVVTLRSAATLALAPGLAAEVGNEMEAVHLGQTLAAIHPFASITIHTGATTVRYRMASSPEVEQASELDRASTLSPRVSERAGALRLEQGLHQALEVDRDTGHWKTQLAYYHDAVDHPLIGGGVAILHGRPALSAADAGSGELLYDPVSQLIATSGQSYAGSGLVAVARNQLTPDTWISLRYAVGQAVAMGDMESLSLGAALSGMRAHPSSMVAASVGSRLEHAGTEWRASYRWQPSDTLTQVDPFDSSAPEAYLSFHVRQPIPVQRLGSRGMQAVVDVRNLLAQGYRPFLSQDGSTLYFAQAERCVEGGLSFSF